MTRKRSIGVYSIVVFATIILLLSGLTIWAQRQVLNTDNWVKSSDKVLADPNVRTSLSSKLVDLLYERVDVQAQLKDSLPKGAQGAAPAAAAGLRIAAQQAVVTLLGTPQAQEIWENANRRAHEALINVLKGNSAGPVSTANGAVTLDLEPLITQVAARVGIDEKEVQSRTNSSGQIVLLKSDQLQATQDAVKILNALSQWLIVVALLLYALAIYLAKTRRRIVLEVVGCAFIFSGLVLLIVRRALGDWVVGSLVKTQAQRPAVHAIWNIETELLRNIAFAGIAYGVIAILAGLLGGPSKYATWVRREIAPHFRENPAVVFGIAAGVFLVIVAWGPVQATRSLIGIVILAVLIGVGLEVLRRMTLREFPASGQKPKAEAAS